MIIIGIVGFVAFFVGIFFGESETTGKSILVVESKEVGKAESKEEDNIQEQKTPEKT